MRQKNRTTKEKEKKKMAKRSIKSISVLSLALILLVFCSLNIWGAAPADASAAVGYAFGRVSYSGVFAEKTVSTSVLSRETLKEMKLYVGGMPFGVKFLTEGVLIVGFNDNAAEGGENPARTAGLRVNDTILSVNGVRIVGAAELNEIIGSSNGKPLQVKYSRGGHEYTATLTPIFSQSEGRYSTGAYVRDSGAGIGTVTFIDPQTRAFGGLGHGICDAETGRLIPMQRGSVVGVRINGIVKGLSGTPGEVKGYFNSGKTGTLLSNTDCGVYGVFAELPKTVWGEPVSLGLRDSVRAGKAYVYTMLDSERVEKYEIEIGDIQRDATGNKCYTVKVTDKALLSKTGGIIQGMSGSPIVQDGKLIGAVTHVLINDPATGYGIFIENMLNKMGDLAS